MSVCQKNCDLSNEEKFFKDFDSILWNSKKVYGNWSQFHEVWQPKINKIRKLQSIFKWYSWNDIWQFHFSTIYYDLILAEIFFGFVQLFDVWEKKVPKLGLWSWRSCRKWGRMGGLCILPATSTETLTLCSWAELRKVHFTPFFAFFIKTNTSKCWEFLSKTEAETEIKLVQKLSRLSEKTLKLRVLLTKCGPKRFLLTNCDWPFLYKCGPCIFGRNYYYNVVCNVRQQKQNFVESQKVCDNK